MFNGWSWKHQFQSVFDLQSNIFFLLGTSFYFLRDSKAGSNLSSLQMPVFICKFQPAFLSNSYDKQEELQREWGHQT